MLAPRGVEALHGMCMPNHSRGRIRAAALRARYFVRGILKKMRLTDHNLALTTHDGPFECWSTEVQGMNGKDEEGGR